MTIQMSKRLSRQELYELTLTANIPTLLMVIFQVTGDTRWLQEPFRPTRSRGLSDHDTGGLSPEIQDEIRHAAADAFHELQEGGSPAITHPTPAQTTTMLGVCVGEPVDSSYGEMFAAEFRQRIGLSDSGKLGRIRDGFRVLVIGAGVSGLIAAQKLGELGVPYLMVDEHPAAGGNWLDNRYPGAGVDTPSHLYSFSFAPKDWGHHFELRPQLAEYFSETFDAIGASSNTRFATRVESATFSEENASWTVRLRDLEGGSIEDHEFAAVVSAVGVLNRPKVPSLPGMDSFQGPSFHSSHWPEDLSLVGKRVAVIGSGASAMQIVPAIVDEVSEMVIFQRTPPWVAPFEKFQLPIDPGARYLLDTFPLYRTWYWLKLYWQFGDKVLDSLRKDPAWPHPERAVNAQNDAHRKFFTGYIREQLGDKQDLLFEKVLPDYPPFGKRILLDNGWYQALTEDNVTLVDDHVVEVTDGGVVTSDGSEHAADVLVWATGFEASRFVSSLEVVGRRGVTLREAWNDDDPRAYLGVTVPEFPNLFLLGGPNSFPGSGSFMYFMEVQMRYIAALLKEVSGIEPFALNVKAEVCQRYNDLLEDASSKTVWTHPGTNTFFRNARGRLVFVSPFRNVEYWLLAHQPQLVDYERVVPSERADR